MNTKLLDNRLLLLGCFSTWCFIFFSVVPYAVAGKHISTALMVAVLLALLLRKQVQKVPLSWVTVSGIAVIGVALLSAISSPYAADALSQFRKDALPFLLGFLLLNSALATDRKRTILYSMLSLMFGYAVKEILAIWAGSINGFRFSIYEEIDVPFPKYLEFFSSDTPYYLPFLLGPLFFWQMRIWQRFILFLVVTLAVFVVVLSGVRTAFVFVVASVLSVFLYRFWKSKKTLFSVLAAFVLCGYLLKDRIINPSIARYTTITSTQTYQFGKDGSVSERYAIMKGVWEVSKDRLLLGYGPGWKKLPTVAEANGHMERWRQSDEPIDKLTLNYFSYGEGRVNPHNLYMELLFENGILGLVAYVSFMLATAVAVLKMVFRDLDSLEKGAAVASTLYLMVYFGNSIASGLWLPVTMLVTVVLVMSYQGKLQNPQFTSSDGQGNA